MSDLLGVLEFIGFVIGGAVVVLLRKRRNENQQRATTGLFLLYVVGVSFGNGIVQLNLWPFSSWGLVRWSYQKQPDETLIIGGLLVGVTASGSEHDIDQRAFEPLNFHELAAWISGTNDLLTPEEQARAGQYLLDRANQARGDALEGRRPGYLRRFLGPFTAPAHVLFAEGWTTPTDVPTAPFVAVRWYQSRWKLEPFTGAPVEAGSELVYAFPAVP